MAKTWFLISSQHKPFPLLIMWLEAGVWISGSVAIKVKAWSELCGLYLRMHIFSLKWPPFERGQKSRCSPLPPCTAGCPNLLQSQMLSVGPGLSSMPIPRSHGHPKLRSSVTMSRTLLLAQIRSTQKKKKKGERILVKVTRWAWGISLSSASEVDKNLEVEGCSLLHHCLLSTLPPYFHPTKHPVQSPCPIYHLVQTSAPVWKVAFRSCKVARTHHLVRGVKRF